jgi:hypothetical protein
MPLVRRVAFIFFGLCLAINLIPAAWMFLNQSGVVFPGSHVYMIANGAFAGVAHFVLTVILALFGIFGLGMLIAGVRTSKISIKADKDGLTTTKGGHQRLTPWSSIADISWRPGAMGQFVYRVKSNVSPYFIFWPAGPHLTRAFPPGEGAVPIGADELAALVAARSGKPIEVRR